MKLRFLLFTFLVVTSLTSCLSESRLRKKLVNTWYVEEILVDNVRYHSQDYFVSNSFKINKHDCLLPTMMWGENTWAKWEYLEAKSKRMGYPIIEISNTKVDIFNQEYKVIFGNKHNSTTLTLESNRVTFFCFR